jgi:outer membrane protein assembly factor BamB
MKPTKIFLILGGCLLLALANPGATRDPLWRAILPGASAGSPAVFSAHTIVATKNGSLIALDGTGRLAWKQKLPGGCLAAPAIDGDGSIYVACAEGTLMRFSASGKELWRTALGQEMFATPLLGRDDAYTVSGTGRICRIGKKDGAVRKQAELGLPAHSSPVWDADRTTLLVPLKDFLLVAVEPELAVRWKFRTAGVIHSAPAVTPRNEIYLTSMDHHIYKLDQRGRLLWKFKARGWIKASPVIDEKGRVYFGSYDRNFYAVSADGKAQWQFTGKAQFTSSAVIDGTGNLYCGDTSGTVYALDRHGKLLWQYKSPDFITADLTILPNKVLLAGSIDGVLLAFRTGQPLSKKAWWAKYLGNLANSGFDEQ